MSFRSSAVSPERRAAVPKESSGPPGDAELIAAALLALVCLAVSFASLLAVALLAADIA